MFLCGEIVAKVKLETNMRREPRLKGSMTEKIGMERHPKSGLATNDSVNKVLKSITLITLSKYINYVFVARESAHL